MRITKVKLDNYVCFYKAPEFELGPGINFVVGKNNSGKTALVNALTPTIEGHPHRSQATAPESNPAVSDLACEIEYEFGDQEIVTLLRRMGRRFYLPLSPASSSDSWGQRFRHGMPNGFLSAGSDRLRFHYNSDGLTAVNLDGYPYIFHLTSDATHDCYLFEFNDEMRMSRGRLQYQSVSNDVISCSATDVCWSTVERQIPSLIFRFQAERRISATDSPSGSSNLASDASNLPQVLHTLKNTKDERFREYFHHVALVFPTITEILTIPHENEIELTIGEYDPPLGLDHLRRSLDAYGTGLGQVMAMLYVVHHYQDPRVIIIDEPHSFLHPGAIRMLLEIFGKFPQHQYILTTHSPTAIMSVDKKTVLLVARRNKASKVKSVNVDDNAELEEALEELGTRRSDIFGMDTYIWVEGKTDKICFNLVMDKHGGLPAGVEIIDLVHTGDFRDKKRGALIEQVYARLSGSVGILPSVLAFVFDGDLQNDDFEETDTRKFLPRQNYESYLIAPEILADILNRDAADDKSKDHTADSVKQWIRKKEGKEYDDLEWLATVDGKNFLNKLFNCLGGISYKDHTAAYGEEITSRILADNPNHFQEIVDLIKRILNRDKQPEAT